MTLPLGKNNLSIIKILENKFYLFRNELIRENTIFTHLTENEKIMMHRLLKKRPSSTICAEIGSFLGASACFICNALPDAKLFCIDTWGNQNMKYVEADTEDERDTYDEFLKNTTKYARQIIKLREWSTEAIHLLKKRIDRLDFLFIDGDHHYDGVKKDWELYSPLLHTGSIVAFHDTGWAEGVRKVITEDVENRAQFIAGLPNIMFFEMN